MATKDDEVTGYCCCALIAVVAVIALVRGFLEFIGNHPVWTAVIALAVIALTVLVVIGAKTETESVSTAERRKSNRGVPPSEASARDTVAGRQGSHATMRLPNAGEEYDRLDQYQRGVDAAAGVEAGPARESTDEEKSSQDGRPHDMPSVPAPHPEREIGLSFPRPAIDAAVDPAVIPASSGNVSEAPSPVMEPAPFLATIKDLLRRDDWAILGAGIASGRGGIDFIVGRGHTVVAVQHHAAKIGSALDTSDFARLLAAPFHVHGIREVAIVSSVPISDGVRQVAESGDLKVHLIDGEEFLEWRAGRRRLEPMWGLITPV